MSTAFFTYDGNDLGALYGLILGRRKMEFIPKPRERIVYVMNRPGSHDFGVDLGERLISLDCFILRTTRADLESAIYSIASRLDPTNETSGDRGFKKLVFDSLSDRYFLARLASASPPALEATTADLTLVFRCADPFAYATNESTATGTTPVVFTTGGTYPMDPIIDIVASGAYTGNVTITDAYGSVLTWNGTLAGGNTLRIDSTTYRVFKNGTVSMAGVQAASVWPRLKAGVSNTISIGGLAAITSTTVTYRNRWL